MRYDEHLRALTLADGGDWDGAHQLIQRHEDAMANWIHANLHREEGDHGNAAFWYSRARQRAGKGSCAEERATIRQSLLKQQAGH